MSEQFTPNMPHQGVWLVYINGLEIPNAQVSVSYGVWQIPSATIALPPHRALQRLGNEDKLEVVVFFLDDYADPDRPEFKLCFEGHIIGWSYANSPTGRTMQFDCIADIEVFTSLYFFFMNSVDAVVGAGTQPGFGAQSIPQPGAFYPFSLFKKGLISTDIEAQPDITRPYQLLENVMRGVLSDKIRPDLRTYPSVNFFARWARKRNFINRSAALPLFEDEGTEKGLFPILQSVQAEFALKTMQQNLASTIGEAGSLFDVLRQTLGLVYCELAMIPTAPCFRVRLEDGTILGPASLQPSSPDRAAREPLRVVNYFVKPQMLFGVAPSCNVIYPSMSPSYQYRESYKDQPTRTYLNDTLITGLTPQNPYTSSALTTGYPAEVNAVLRQKAGDEQTSNRDVVSNGKNVLVYPEEFFRGPLVSRAPVPSWFTLLKNKDPANQPSDGPTQQASNTDAEQTYKIAKLYELYAQYEHFRQRYEKRGGAVDLAFNPYLVPGFPCVIFDQRSQAFDNVGYLMSVTLNMSKGGMSTSASYSFGRTVQEMFDLLRYDMSRLGVVLASAPAEPVDSVRRISQDQNEAERFYNALFYGRAQDPSRKSAFDFRDAVGYGEEEDELEPLHIEGPTLREKSITFLGYEQGVPLAPAVGLTGVPELDNNPVLNPVLTPQPAGPAVTFQAPTNNLDGSSDIQPTTAFKAVFESYDAAMQHVARPICTLREYIQFVHGGKALPRLMEEGVVEGANEQFCYEEVDPQDYGSAVYFERIFRRRAGPGERPPPAQVGASVQGPTSGGTVDQASPYTGSPAGVPADFPQTRADWDSVLEAYRREIYSSQAPQR